jgi:hypothetical protein
MLRTWKQARRRKLVRGQSGTTEAAGMIKPDRPRQIDAVIDYFGGTREARVARRATAVRHRNGQVFTTDGLSLAITSSGGQVVDLSVLIRRQSRLDDHSPAPPASAPPLILRRLPPARHRESGFAPAARRVQAIRGPAQAAHSGPPLLDWADQGLDRVEAVPRVRDSRDGPALAPQGAESPIPAHARTLAEACRLAGAADCCRMR